MNHLCIQDVITSECSTRPLHNINIVIDKCGQGSTTELYMKFNITYLHR